jgi:hypothetical protein
MEYVCTEPDTSVVETLNVCDIYGAVCLTWVLWAVKPSPLCAVIVIPEG